MDGRSKQGCSPDPSCQQGKGRDARIDLVRGLALICIFFDHIPNNVLARITIGNFGFSDASEVFVLLAGFSAYTAFGAVYDSKGPVAFAKKIAGRCLTIYGTHIGLVLVSILILELRLSVSGAAPTLLAPIIQDGAAGLFRAVTLGALPTYLDILPLYLVLLALFPVIFVGIRTSPLATMAVSVAVYLIANAMHANVPNHIDRLSTGTWSFNPYTWQLIYVLGAVLAAAKSRNSRLFLTPPALLRNLCWSFLVFALLCARWGDLDPRVQVWIPTSLMNNEAKSFVCPWRVLNVVALAYLVLTSSRLLAKARWPALKPVQACGRHSLMIFAAGCILSLLGRLMFKDLGQGMAVQACVNTAGLAILIWIASLLDSRKSVRAAAPATLGPPAPQLVG